MSPIERMVERWCATERAHAFVKSDHDVIESTASVRALIAEQLMTNAPRTEADRDLLNAFGVLGRMVAERGGSPTLAASIVDGALSALAPASAPASALASAPAPASAPALASAPAPASAPALAPAPAWVLPARAALAEAYALSRLETAFAESAARWEYPRCAVGLADGTVAIAAGFPDDDHDALGAWASRVAHDAAMAGVRRVVVSGSAAAEAALESALELAGIARVAGLPPPTKELPLRR
jgi:hypothetical protein